MKKVYADTSLGYLQEERFDIPLDSLQVPTDTIHDIIFKETPNVTPAPEAVEEDVESYFE